MGHSPRKSVWPVLGFALAVTLGTMPLVQAQVLTPTATVVVVDANQTVVGPALGGFGGGGASAFIAFQVDPYVVAISVTNTRLLATTFSPGWESNDCTGPPVMNVNEAGGIETQMFTPVMIVSHLNPGQDILGRVRVADPFSIQKSVTIRSTIINSNPAGCINLEASQDSFQATVVDTIEIMDLDALFTPPFHVEVVDPVAPGKGMGIGKGRGKGPKK
jgi:flavin reductase (DIM6/NTAB) family NADH-FMN oxidoreductase RutF